MQDNLLLSSIYLNVGLCFARLFLPSLLYFANKVLLWNMMFFSLKKAFLLYIFLFFGQLCMSQDLSKEKLDRIEERLKFGDEAAKTMWDSVSRRLEESPKLSLVKELDDQLTSNSSNPVMFHLRGLLFLDLGLAFRAVDDFRRSIELDSTKAEHHFALGLAYDQLDVFNIALESFSSALAIDSSIAEYYFQRGEIHHKMLHYNDALLDYHKCIKIDPNHPEVYYSRAIVFGTNRMFKEAIKDYTVDIEVNGSSPKSHNNRGRCYMIQEKYKKANADYDKAIELDAEWKAAYFNKWALYLRQEKTEEGCPYLIKAKELGIDDNGSIIKYCSGE